MSIVITIKQHHRRVRRYQNAWRQARAMAASKAPEAVAMRQRRARLANELAARNGYDFVEWIDNSLTRA